MKILDRREIEFNAMSVAKAIAVSTSGDPEGPYVQLCGGPADGLTVPYQEGMAILYVDNPITPKAPVIAAYGVQHSIEADGERRVRAYFLRMQNRDGTPC